jgi:hypothetical protein
MEGDIEQELSCVSSFARSSGPFHGVSGFHSANALKDDGPAAQKSFEF